MSRSYKKPYLKDGNGSQWKAVTKRLANKSVRLYAEIKDGGQYKKCFNSWNICDYCFYYPQDPKSWRK